MKFITSAALATIAALAFTNPASAQEQSQQQCAPRENLDTALYTSFGETQQFRMINADGVSLTEVFANEETGSWTTVVTNTENVSCVVAEGAFFTDADDHEMLALTPPTAPAPAQQNCGSRIGIIGALNTEYGEKEQSIMLNSDFQNAVEIFANEETGSWSVLITTGEGNSCIISEGVGFEDFNGRIPPHLPRPGIAV